MHTTRNTLSENVRTLSVELLNKHLSASIDLAAQVKQAHWNVRGTNFIALHELFDTVATAVGTYSDQIAERTGGLGGTAEGTVQTATARSFLVPYDLGIADGAQHVFAVAGSLAAFGESSRAAIGIATTQGDLETADLFTEVARGIARQLWLVESHAEPKTSVGLNH
ncbi:DNA starvation/stationary phase protection protein Dps [Pleomorphomonas sp. PLEO]|uniref:DNA starvation/stationary phase protection protein Dps n=1 Tax=Pleomorphomonas sp. PLEO TaxID=3239306 RepID=UPI00351E4DD5